MQAASLCILCCSDEQSLDGLIAAAPRTTAGAQLDIRYGPKRHPNTFHHLARCTNCSSLPRSPLQERFRRSLPGVEAWQARVVQECKRQGYVEVRCCFWFVALVAGMLLVGAAGVQAPRLHGGATFCLMWQHSRVQEGDSECLRHSTMLLLLNIAPADHRRAAALPARNQLQERPEAGGSRAQGQEHGGAGVRWGVAGHAVHAVLAARWLGVLGMLSLRHRECMH